VVRFPLRFAKFLLQNATKFGSGKVRVKPKIVGATVLRDAMISINKNYKHHAVKGISADGSVAILEQWLPRATQRAAGYHEPYKVADIEYPYRFELRHTLIIGDRRTGKSQIVNDIVSQVVALHDRAVIFDRTGDYVARFYQKGRDHILHPFDARCSPWSFFADLTREADFVAAADLLFPTSDEEADALWVPSARTLFVDLCCELHAEGGANNADLADSLRAISFDAIEASLHAHCPDQLMTFDISASEAKVRQALDSVAERLQAMAHDRYSFSIRNWIIGGFQNSSLLFISALYCQQGDADGFIQLWLDIALAALPLAPPSNTVQHWIVIDDVGVLYPLRHLPAALEKGGAHGAAILLTADSMLDLTSLYGRETALKMFDRIENKIMLKAADDPTALAFANAIWGIDHHISAGDRLAAVRAIANASGQDTDAGLVNISPSSLKQISPFTGYLKFANAFPAARVAFERCHYPDRAEAFALPVRALPLSQPALVRLDQSEPQLTLPLSSEVPRTKVIIEHGPAPGMGDDDYDKVDPEPTHRPEHTGLGKIAPEKTSPKKSGLSDKQLDVTKWGSLREATARLGGPHQQDDQS
jgi:Type IV secretion-system coupling protein DNA-binding domain